jgi:hypothetical protein
MSLPPSATPRSVASRDDTHDNRFFHRQSIASKKSIPDVGPPSAVTSYHLSSVAPSTPFSVAPTPVTPRATDATRVQPSLQ